MNTKVVCITGCRGVSGATWMEVVADLGHGKREQLTPFVLEARSLGLRQFGAVSVLMLFGPFSAVLGRVFDDRRFGQL